MLALLLIPQLALAESSEIKLGGLFDLSSEAGKVWGTAEKNAFVLAVEDFQASHTDRNVTYKIEDTQYSNARAVTGFHKLTSVDGIRFIVGPTFEVFVATMPLCQAKQVVCMAPSQHGSEFYRPENVNRFAFTAWFDERGYSDVLAEDIIKLDKKAVAIFGAISPYHDTLVTALAAKIPERIVKTERVPPQDTDFRTLISKLPSSVDAVVMFFPEETALANFISQWHQLRKERPIFFADDTVGYLPSDLRAKVKTFSPAIYYSSPLLPEEMEKQFAKKYLARFGVEPEAPSASVSYDETLLLLGCIEQNAEVAAVRNCISKTSDYQGFSGTISFNGKQSVTTRSFRISQFE